MARIIALILVAQAVLGCGKLGAGSSSGGGSSSPGVVTPAEPSPKIEITTPARASFLAVGQAAVEGKVTGVSGETITAVILDGQALAPDANGVFRGSVNLVEGLNVIDASCVDSRNRLGSTSIGVLAGNYTSVQQPVPHAGIARVNDAVLDAIGKIAEGAIWQADWTQILTGLNPIYDTNFIGIDVWIDVTQIRYRDVRASLDSQPGKIVGTIDVQEPILDVTMVVNFWGIGQIGPVAAVVQADSGRITGNLVMAARPDGSIAVSAQNAATNFQNFRMSVANGVIDTAVQLFALGAIEDALTDSLNDAVTGELPLYLERTLAEFLYQQKPYDMLGKPFFFDLRAEQITFDDRGLSISTSFNAHGGVTPTPRGQAAPGAFTTAGAAPASIPARGFFVTGDDDAFNRVLHAMWAGGLFDLEIDDAFLAQQNTTLPIPLEVGSFRRFLPEIGAVAPDSAPIKLATEFGLPPIVRVTGSPDLVEVQAGEVMIDIFVDRGQGFEKLLRAVAHLEMGGNVGLTGQGLQVSSLGTPQFHFDLIEEPMVEIDDHRLEVLLSVMFTPMLPHLLNSLSVVGIPHLAQLTAVNVDVYPDGPAAEHVSVAGDLLR